MLNDTTKESRKPRAQSILRITSHQTMQTKHFMHHTQLVDKITPSYYLTAGSVHRPIALSSPLSSSLLFIAGVHRHFYKTQLTVFLTDYDEGRRFSGSQSVSRRTCYCCFLPNMASEGKVLIVRIAVDIFCWLAKNPFSSWIIKQLLLQIYTKSFIIAWVEAEEEQTFHRQWNALNCLNFKCRLGSTSRRTNIVARQIAIHLPIEQTSANLPKLPSK